MADLIVKISEIPPGTGKQFEVNGNPIAVFNVEGVFYAMDDTCTHAGASLAEGTIEEGAVVCPWHGATFDLKSGRAKTLPAVEGVKTYPVTLSGDQIKIEV